jgi:hypothetical protein
MGRFLRLSNGVPRSFDEASVLTIYDQVYVVGGGGLTTGTSITLPGGQTYTSEELEIYLNGQRVKLGDDYTSTSSTQVAFTFDLLANEQVRFRIDRLP